MQLHVYIAISMAAIVLAAPFEDGSNPSDTSKYTKLLSYNDLELRRITSQLNSDTERAKRNTDWGAEKLKWEQVGKKWEEVGKKWEGVGKQWDQVGKQWQAKESE